MTSPAPTYDCAQVYVLLYEYLDEGLSEERRSAIEAHLTACAHCHDVAELQRQVRELTAQSGELGGESGESPGGAHRFPVGSGIKERLHRLLSTDQPTPAGSFPDPAASPGVGTPVASPNAAITEEDAAEARSQMAG